MRPIGIIVLVASLAILPSPAAEPDPWARVPALPTGCYRQDSFAEKVSAAREALTRDLQRQEGINREISDKIKTVEPMELASRQQKFMMEHPQEAMQLMQRNRQLGEEYTNGELASHAEAETLERDLAAIDDRYKAALGNHLAPVIVKFKDLDARASKDPVRTEAGDYYAPWAVKEWNQLIIVENTAYEKVCAEWWSASGPYHDWLRRYREHLLQRIPQREEAENVGNGFMVHLIDTPQGSFRPTSGFRAVGEYMDKVNQVFAKRRAEPGKAQGELILGQPPH
jgi:hypothetical protein